VDAADLLLRRVKVGHRWCLTHLAGTRIDREIAEVARG